MFVFLRIKPRRWLSIVGMLCLVSRPCRHQSRWYFPSQSRTKDHLRDWLVASSVHCLKEAKEGDSRQAILPTRRTKILHLRECGGRRGYTKHSWQSRLQYPTFLQLRTLCQSQLLHRIFISAEFTSYRAKVVRFPDLYQALPWSWLFLLGRTPTIASSKRSQLFWQHLLEVFIAEATTL